MRGQRKLEKVRQFYNQLAPEGHKVGPPKKVLFRSLDGMLYPAVGSTTLDTIFTAISMAVKTRRPVVFNFQGVIVEVCHDSKFEQIDFCLHKALKHLVQPFVGAYCKVEFTDKEIAREEFMLGLNEKDRIQRLLTERISIMSGRIGVPVNV
jgi:hypothetical protein